MTREKTQRISICEVKPAHYDEEGIKQPETVKEIRKAWASIDHKSGAQKWGDGRYSSTVTDLFTINYVPGFEVTPEMTLTWKGKQYDIESAENIHEENLDVEIRAVYVGPAKGR